MAYPVKETESVAVSTRKLRSEKEGASGSDRGMPRRSTDIDIPFSPVEAFKEFPRPDVGVEIIGYPFDILQLAPLGLGGPVAVALRIILLLPSC
jgi:hypothetical protein